MKLGLGLYRHMLTNENFRFAKQAGATHIVAHLINYFNNDNLSTASGDGVFGVSDNPNPTWSFEELDALRKSINDEGLELAAIENFDPIHWYDILLDGPRKKEQMENIKTTIRNMGRAGIPCIGYYFSIAGVWGRTEIQSARGEAMGVGFIESQTPPETPIPNGTVWNMIYDQNAPSGYVGNVSHEEIWQRMEDFLVSLVPVAEEAGVRLASHPDDPPLPVIRGTARLVTQPQHYQRLLDLVPNHYNSLEMCLGTISEMADGEFDLYEAVDRYSKQEKISFIHFRNVRGKVPNYEEVFVDEGDIDMFRVLQILHKNNFDGVIIPDHTPQMSCDAPWHAGMAYALGWMKASMSAIERM
jgi:mannonate dehydratase